MNLPSNFVRQLIVCVALSLIFYGVWVGFSGTSDVLDSVTRIGWAGWLYVLGLSLVNYGLRLLRWGMYLRRLGYRVPAGVTARTYLAGFAFTTTPGKVGEAIRSVYLKPHGVRYSHSLAALFAERLSDLLAMIVVAALAAFAFADTRWLVIVAILLALVAIPLVHSRFLRTFTRWVAAKFRSERVSGMAEHALTMLDSSRELLRSGPMLSGFVLGLIAWGAEGYGLYVVLERMGASVPATLSAGIYGVSILAGVASFVPGGLGGTEIVMGSLLVLAGVAAPVTVSAVLICRLATLWFAVLIGLVALVDLELRRPSAADTSQQERA